MDRSILRSGRQTRRNAESKFELIWEIFVLEPKIIVCIILVNDEKRERSQNVYKINKHFMNSCFSKGGDLHLEQSGSKSVKRDRGKSQHSSRFNEEMSKDHLQASSWLPASAKFSATNSREAEKVRATICVGRKRNVQSERGLMSCDTRSHEGCTTAPPAA